MQRLNNLRIRFLITSLFFIASLGLVSPVLMLQGPVKAAATSTFVFTNNDINGPNTVSAFQLDSTGFLTQVTGSPFATGGTGGNGSTFVAASRANATVVGNFLYVSNAGSAN